MRDQSAKKNIDLMNLAFILKELASKIQELDEDDLETLELLLDEEVIEMLNTPESARKYFTHEEVFGHALPQI